MSAKNFLELQESNKGFWFILILLVMALALFGYNVYQLSIYTNQDKQYIANSNELQVLSQQIAKISREAAIGEEDTIFNELRTTQRKIENNIQELENGIPNTLDPSPEVVVGQLSAVRSTWNDMSANVDTLLKGEDPIFIARQNTDQLTATIPSMQKNIDEMVRALIKRGAPAAQIYIASQQLSTVDRMQRRSTEIKQQSAAVTTATALESDAERFEMVLLGLLNGNAELGIRKITVPEAITKLTSIIEIFEGNKLLIQKIREISNDLVEARQATEGVLEKSESLRANSEQLANAYTNDLDGSRLFSTTTAAILGVVSVILLVILGLNLIVSSRKRAQATEDLNQRNQEAIMKLLDEMGSLAEGDLTVKATVTEDITGAIADSVNFAVEALRSLVATINDTALQLSSATQETRATAMHLTEASNHQTQEITSASADVNEMAQSIDQVSKNAVDSADVAQKSVTIAKNGANVVRQTIDGMDTIREQIQETSKRIKRLGESSQEIGNIIELINDIAEQTNILSLNAAIQAASAGEAGRGFAVVADEVQRLAERASNATKQIEDLVKAIQSDTNEAVISMEQTTSEVVTGAKLAENAGEALGEIEAVSTDLASLIENISGASSQQAKASTKISETMKIVMDITNQTSQGTTQTAESIGNLTELATNLRNSVADFKLPDDQSARMSAV